MSIDNNLTQSSHREEDKTECSGCGIEKGCQERTGNNKKTVFLKIPQAAEYLGLAQQTLRVWVMHRKIPFYKIGSYVRFKQMDLDNWIEERRVEIKEG